MQITINTKEDSIEEMKKVITILSSIVESRGGEPASMYGEGQGESGIFNLFDEDKKEDKEGTPEPVRIVEY